MIVRIQVQAKYAEDAQRLAERLPDLITDVLSTSPEANKDDEHLIIVDTPGYNISRELNRKGYAKRDTVRDERLGHVRAGNGTHASVGVPGPG